ncbi:hypothetical protein M427DRAFT_45858 [Gonapodya prolifera JEL478]|uniref:Uncharacterized protein n=1 Tax=Gonapodya prolifera (strain JEL478) TaxID=1344416 RepID=A0A139A9E1_GONPJ|nr:hypothetical protein M427DRAFT_45858 [Gonapodya prolifera JEL478]|eukprot:KXS13304.1 hypothetical protein M427DRAFT_45858 [Gonapodya prolifera JEL478]
MAAQRTNSGDHFPAHVAEAYPHAHAVYEKLSRRISTIEKNSLAVSSSLEVVHSSEDSDAGARATMAELVRQQFSPLVYDIYIRWKPALEGMLETARELQTAADQLKEAEAAFTALFDKNEQHHPDPELSTELEDSLPLPMKLIKPVHPKQYRKYLRYRLKLHEMETAAENLVRLGDTLERKREDFLTTTAAVEELDKRPHSSGQFLTSPDIAASSMFAMGGSGGGMGMLHPGYPFPGTAISPVPSNDSKRRQSVPATLNRRPSAMNRSRSNSPTRSRSPPGQHRNTPSAVPAMSRPKTPIMEDGAGPPTATKPSKGGPKRANSKRGRSTSSPAISAVRPASPALGYPPPRPDGSSPAPPESGSDSPRVASPQGYALGHQSRTSNPTFGGAPTGVRGPRPMSLNASHSYPSHLGGGAPPPPLPPLSSLSPQMRDSLGFPPLNAPLGEGHKIQLDMKPIGIAGDDPRAPKRGGSKLFKKLVGWF